MKKTTFPLTFIFLLFISSVSHSFPQNYPKPGGISIIAVAPANEKKPTVHFKSKPVAVINNGKNWLAIIGISLKAKLGWHKIFISQTINGNIKKSTQKFFVKKHNYRTQHITIKNKNKVTPNKRSQKRIEKEFHLKNKLKASFSNITPSMDFIRPTTGRDSGRFGLRRILNKKSRNPHSGMDIAAPKGRKVKATEAGKVIFIGDLFFTGNTIYLDHGNGLISLYAHLSKVTVKRGQLINRGDIIGHVGSTGRATGAHLHWSVYLNGNAVDPALFLH